MPLILLQGCTAVPGTADPWVRLWSGCMCGLLSVMYFWQKRVSWTSMTELLQERVTCVNYCDIV